MVDAKHSDGTRLWLASASYQRCPSLNARHHVSFRETGRGANEPPHLLDLDTASEIKSRCRVPFHQSACSLAVAACGQHCRDDLLAFSGEPHAGLLFIRQAVLKEVCTDGTGKSG